MIKKILFCIGILFLVHSCNDIISINISNEIPVILTPSMGDSLDVSPINIKWEKMKGATKYRLQIVSPSFDDIEFFVLDTIISNTSFYANLDSNQYELKLSAINSGYTSLEKGPVRFWIGTNSPNQNNKVILVSPSDSLVLNSNNVPNFNWLSFNNSISYEFSLRKGDSFYGANVLSTLNNIVTNSINSPLQSYIEGVYWWGIKAYTANSETVYSYRCFLIDNTNPNIPILVSPSDFSTINSNLISFNWSNGVDQGVIKSTIHSRLEISSDNTFGSLVYSEEYNGTSCQVSLSPGIYFWRVKNFDQATNESNYSQTFSFTKN